MGVFTAASVAAAVANKIAAAGFWNNQVKALIDGFGAGTTWTPTLGGGWALGNGSMDAAYTLIQKQMFLSIAVTWGTTSTFGGTSLTFTLPSGITLPRAQVLAVRAGDASAAASYDGVAGITTGGVCTPIFTPAAAGGASRGATSTIPFTWASSDVVVISGSVEVA